MNNNIFFSNNSNQSSQADYSEIYNSLKKLSKNKIKNDIDKHYKNYGHKFLEEMTLNSILDIEIAPNNPNPNLNVFYIEKYCERLIDQDKHKNDLKKILNALPVWLVAIGTAGLFLLELIKFILAHFYICG
jgi:hypothetical protein